MPPGKKKLKPPPDYSSRRVQYRLLLAVGALLFVMTLMFEARKAEYWQWMWSGVPRVASEPEDIDTRLSVVETNDPPGTVYANSQEDPADVIEQASRGEQREALRRLELDAWRKLLDKLEHAERTELDRLLLASRDPAVEASEAVPSDELPSKIAAEFTEYLNTANEAVMLAGDSLADRQKESLLNALRELEIAWNQRWLPALQAPADAAGWTSADRAALEELQSIWDALAIKSIRDDSFWRPDEQHAWFRWFEILKRTDPEQLRRESTGEVGFLQLFKQSDEYRGKLVTIRGTARLAYRVEAPDNIHGISNYVVYWVKPAVGPNSPIVVYALETPEGFPEVKYKERDGETSLDEEVAFTGFFFKRWAYPGQSGLLTAPLLLARGPRWTDDSTVATGPPMPSLPVAAGAVTVVLLLSIVLAVLAYRSGKTSALEGTSLRKADGDQLEALKEEPVLPSAEEALRNLAANDKEEQ